jgi:predicted  nucleic acid-binding Zn-ribbon protein
MKKADEIYLLDSLIQQTPKNSYLRTMLDHMRVQFESDIRSDFSTLPDFRQIEREAVELRKRNDELEKQKADVEREIRAQREQQASMYRRLEALKKEAVEFAAAMERAVNTFHVTRY